MWSSGLHLYCVASPPAARALGLSVMCSREHWTPAQLHVKETRIVTVLPHLSHPPTSQLLGSVVCSILFLISLMSVFWPTCVAAEACEGPMQAPVPHISIRVSSEASRSTKPRRRASGPNILRPALPGPPPRLKKGTLAIPLLICFASHSTQSLYYKRVYFPVTSVNSYLFDMGLVRLLQNFLELLIQCYLVLAAAPLSPASCLPAFSLLFRVVQ